MSLVHIKMNVNEALTRRGINIVTKTLQIIVKLALTLLQKIGAVKLHCIKFRKTGGDFHVFIFFFLKHSPLPNGYHHLNLGLD